MMSRKTLSTILLILVLILLAVGAYFWATGMISSNYAYRSPLDAAPPAPGQDLGEPAASRVVLVLIDALRYDTSMDAGVMPTLAALRQSGASARMHSRPPSYSAPGYSTILTGAWPEINGGPAFNLDYEDIPVITQDNMFSAAHRKGLTTAISAYNWFEKLVPQSDVDLSFYTAGDDAAADRQVVDAALPWLQQGTSQLTLIHIDQVDYAGHHEGGPASSNWAAAASRSDALLAEILKKLDLEQDTLIVLSDHGQIDAGGHGGQDAIVLLEPFVMAGKGVQPGTYADMNMVDVAPTIAALLGANLPATTQGRVLEEMLKLPQAVSANLDEATRDQQSALLSGYAQAVLPSARYTLPESGNVDQFQQALTDIKAQRLMRERLWRSAVAALFLALCVTLLIRSGKRAVPWLLAGLGYTFLFHLRYALIDRKVYSLSSVTGETELIVYIAVTTLLALLIAWLVTVLVQKPFQASPLASARWTVNLGLTTIFLTSLPVVLSFVLNGALVTWTLPDYFTSFLALISLIEVLVLSASSLLLAGVSALVSILAKRRISQTENAARG